MRWRSPFQFNNTRGSVPVQDGCREIELLISLHADGMASAAEAKRVEAHMVTCEACRKARYWMQATNEVLANRPVVVPPADLSSRIMRAIAASESRAVPSEALRFNTRRAYATAAALVIAAITVSALHLLNGSYPRAHSVVVGSNPTQGAIIKLPVKSPGITQSKTRFIARNPARATSQVASNRVDHAYATPSRQRHTVQLQLPAPRPSYTELAKLPVSSVRKESPRVISGGAHTQVALRPKAIAPVRSSSPSQPTVVAANIRPAVPSVPAGAPNESQVSAPTMPAVTPSPVSATPAVVQQSAPVQVASILSDVKTRLSEANNSVYTVRSYAISEDSRYENNGYPIVSGDVKSR